MTLRSRSLLVVAVVSALALAACSGKGTTASIQPTAPVTTSPAALPSSPAAPTSSSATAGATSSQGGYVPPPLRWSACSGQFQCATLTVPVDYAKPGGAKFQLAVAKLPAAIPSERIGSLFINPGGPGGSGVDFLEQSSSVFTQRLRDHFDLVTFDPRGVSRSDGVHCATNSQLDAYLEDDPDPSTPAIKATYDAATRAFVAGCVKMSGSELAHIGTADAARDIETLRVALGEKTLSYFGFSYGTYLGTVLLAQDAAHVRVAVLDGAVDPAQNLVGFVTGQGLAFEAALQRWFAWCASNSGCEFHSDPSGGDASVISRFDALDAQAGSSPQTSGGRSLDSAEFMTAVAFAMYNRAYWTDLGSALTALASGDASSMFELADSYNSRSSNGTYDDSLDANTAINCLDHTGPSSAAGYYAAAQALAKTAPILGPGIVYQQSSCAYWPIPADPPPTTVAPGAPPTVVVGTIHDPATPYAWAQALAKDIPGAVLLTHNGDGHTAYGPDYPCIQNIVDAALINAKVPKNGLTC